MLTKRARWPRAGATKRWSRLSPQLAHALGEGVYRFVQEREEVALTAVLLPEVERKLVGPLGWSGVGGGPDP
jgi:hypothetical protein